MTRSLPLALLLAAVAAAPAAATPPRFGAPLTISPASQRNLESPAVGVAGSWLAVAWDRSVPRRSGLGIYVRRGTTAGRLRPTEKVGEGAGPAIVAHADGGATVAWTRYGAGGQRLVQVARAEGLRRFGPAQTLAAVRDRVISVQVVSAGARDVVLWAQGVPGTEQTAVRYAVAGSSGRFGPPATLVPDAGPFAAVSAAAGSDGSVIAATPTPLRPPRNTQVAVSTLAARATTFGPPQAVVSSSADAGGEIDAVTVAHGAGGFGLAYAESGHLPELLRTASLTDGAPGPATTVATIDSTDLGKRSGEGPALAIPGAGLPRVGAWAVVETTCCESSAPLAGTVFAADQAADGSWGSPTRLSPPGSLAQMPSAAGTTRGSAVVWATGQFPRYGLAYAARSGTAPFGAAAPLSRDRAVRPPVLAATDDTVAAVWSTNEQRTADRDRARQAIRVALLHEAG